MLFLLLSLSTVYRDFLFICIINQLQFWHFGHENLSTVFACVCVCVASHIILIEQLRDLQHNLPNMISKLYGYGGGFQSSQLAATRFQFNASFNCGKLKAWLATITANWKAYNLWAIIKIGQWDQLTEKFVNLSFFWFLFLLSTYVVIRSTHTHTHAYTYAYTAHKPHSCCCSLPLGRPLFCLVATGSLTSLSGSSSFALWCLKSTCRICLIVLWNYSFLL